MWIAATGLLPDTAHPTISKLVERPCRVRRPLNNFIRGGGRTQLVPLPFPREQFMKPALRDARDAAEDIGQPGQWIDVIEFRRHDQCG